MNEPQARMALQSAASNLALACDLSVAPVSAQDFQALQATIYQANILLQQTLINWQRTINVTA
jgi:hypothetical protein